MIKNFDNFINEDYVNGNAFGNVVKHIEEHHKEIGKMFANYYQKQFGQNNTDYLDGLKSTLPVHVPNDKDISDFWNKYKKTWDSDVVAYKKADNIYLVGIFKDDYDYDKSKPVPQYDIVLFSFSGKPKN